MKCLEILTRCCRIFALPWLRSPHPRPLPVGEGVNGIPHRFCRRAYFYSNERGEPPHVHVQRERFFAKFWLNPVTLASSIRFASHELRAIQRIVEDHRDNFLEAWNEHAGD
ncbi:MAG: DUF4160 domain-containing protein [Gammaproteobacteria bacterium]|nr:DUF4160 domain-containing protein [Gammaproteobacteria bacterium]